MDTAKGYGKKAQAKGMDAFGKMQKSKIYKDASSSINEVRATTAKKYSNIAS